MPVKKLCVKKKPLTQKALGMPLVFQPSRYLSRPVKSMIQEARFLFVG